LQTTSALAAAGIPTGVMFAPVIPALNDQHVEYVVEAAANHGARYAGYVMLRLPREVNGLFKEWLALNYPSRAEHVLSRMRDIRQGQENDSRFGRRFKGTGPIAELVGQRFRRACVRHGLNRSTHTFYTDLFRAPVKETAQLQFF
jgi:DNA repair photolyase